MACCLGSSDDDNRVSPENPKQIEGIPQMLDTDEIAKNRSCTDVFFLIIFAVFLIVMFVLLGYCMSYGDIYRIVNGYDDCGNVCGRKNEFFNENTGCKGMDFREYPYLHVLSEGKEFTDPTVVSRLCVNSCDGYPQYQAVGYRCLPLKTIQVNSYVSKTGLVEFYQEVSEDLHTCWPDIIYLSIIAFVFSFIMLVLFRYVIRVIVWLVLIGVVVVSIAGTIFLWVTYSQEIKEQAADSISKQRTKSYLGFAIVATILMIIACLVIFGLRKRIQLVIELFKEAGKAFSNMPFLIFEPIITLIALTALVGLWIYFAIWIESSGELTIENSTSAKYVKDSTIKVTRWYNVITLFWMSQFIIGCQHMIVAGSVAKWFFTRNKSQLGWPIVNSFRILTRYHLGTVALGSLIIALMKLIRLVFKAVEAMSQDPQNPLTRCMFCCCQCCLGCIEQTIQYLTRNAYIETALTGDSFCAAGRKATEILSSNALRVFAINSVGDFVLLLGKAFVVAITVLIGMELIQKRDNIHHSWVPLVLAGIFAYLISHCFITVYEMTIDTIFICFCEDCDRNDGITRPYYMSRSLMQFVQNTKKSLGVLSGTESGKAWSTTAANNTQSVNTTDNQHAISE